MLVHFQNIWSLSGPGQVTAGVSDSSAVVGCNCIAFCLTRLVFIVTKVVNLSLNTDEAHKRDALSIVRSHKNHGETKTWVEPLGKSESDVQVWRDDLAWEKVGSEKDIMDVWSLTRACCVLALANVKERLEHVQAQWESNKRDDELGTQWRSYMIRRPTVSLLFSFY